MCYSSSNIEQVLYICHVYLTASSFNRGKLLIRHTNPSNMDCKSNTCRHPISWFQPNTIPRQRYPSISLQGCSRVSIQQGEMHVEIKTVMFDGSQKEFCREKGWERGHLIQSQITSTGDIPNYSSGSFNANIEQRWVNCIQGSIPCPSLSCERNKIVIETNSIYKRVGRFIETFKHAVLSSAFVTCSMQKNIAYICSYICMTITL